MRNRIVYQVPHQDKPADKPLRSRLQIERGHLLSRSSIFLRGARATACREWRPAIHPKSGRKIHHEDREVHEGKLEGPDPVS